MDRPHIDADGFDDTLPAKFLKQGLTFADVLLLPAASSTLPVDADVRTRITPTIELALPIVSAVMDTVTESRLAIALARLGGIGVLHRNLSIEDQVTAVRTVKRSQSGMITDPVTLTETSTVASALELMRRYKISWPAGGRRGGSPGRTVDQPGPHVRGKSRRPGR